MWFGRALALPLGVEGRVCSVLEMTGSNASINTVVAIIRVGLFLNLLVSLLPVYIVCLVRLSSWYGDKNHFTCIAPPVLLALSRSLSLLSLFP